MRRVGTEDEKEVGGLCHHYDVSGETCPETDITRVRDYRCTDRGREVSLETSFQWNSNSGKDS